MVRAKQAAGGHRRIPGGWKAVLYAVLVHVAVVVVVVVGFRWSSESAPAGKIVQAVAVDKEPEVRKKPQDKAKLEERARQEELKRKQDEAKRQAALMKTKEDARRKELEAKRRAEATKRKQEAAEAEKRRQAERKKKQEEAWKQQAESALKEQLARQEEQQRQAALAARAQSEADKFKDLIRQRVSRNWAKPPGTSKGLQCVIRVRLVPGGEVIEAQVVQSSGNSLFDRSVENAVYKASPLPVTQDQEVFEAAFRVIDFLFNPEE